MQERTLCATVTWRHVVGWEIAVAHRVRSYISCGSIQPIHVDDDIVHPHHLPRVNLAFAGAHPVRDRHMEARGGLGDCGRAQGALLHIVWVNPTHSRG